jgi:precorrin-4/cobalt-precorrin-4 C11-methyltransferase
VITRVVEELLPAYGGDCPAIVVWRASWPEERIIRGTLGTIAALVAAERVDRTALILVGPALGTVEFRGSALYSPDYDRRFRPAAHARRAEG